MDHEQHKILLAGRHFLLLVADASTLPAQYSLIINRHSATRQKVLDDSFSPKLIAFFYIFELQSEWTVKRTFGFFME